MGEVVQFPRKHNPRLTKKRLAIHLNRSTRWVELRTGEGMPSVLDSRGRRLYDLEEALGWLSGRGWRF